MHIEISPEVRSKNESVRFTAKFLQGSSTVAEINHAPRDIATRWADAMKELYGGDLAIKHSGICRYCGGTDKKGDYCGDCSRVFPRY